MYWTIELPQGAAQLQNGIYVIGRAPGCHIALPDMTVSGQHAELRIQGSRAIIRDLGSRNGTSVDGHRLPAQSPAELTNGSVVTLGTVPLRLRAATIGQPMGPQARGVGGGAVPQRLPSARGWSEARGPQVPPPYGALAHGASRPHLNLSAPPEWVRRLAGSPSHTHGIWAGSAVMLVALLLPWVNAPFLQASYMQMCRMASSLGHLAEMLGSNVSTWPVVLPGLAAVVAGGAVVATFVAPGHSPGGATAAGGLGVIGALAVYIAFATAAGLDLTGALGVGFYLFGLASLALLAVGGAGVWAQWSRQGPR